MGLLQLEQPGEVRAAAALVLGEIGAKDADLGVRSMQSERRLANLATMTDPKTGKLKTQENVVEGPLTYLTSSTEPLDDETETRSFEIAIDESSAQTAAVSLPSRARMLARRSLRCSVWISTRPTKWPL